MRALFFLLGLGVATAAPAPATVTTNGGDYTLANGYVRATFSIRTASISSLKGDFEGSGAYGPQELLGPSGFTLSAKTGAGTMTAKAVVSAAAVKVVSSGPMLAQIVVTGIRALGATETWLLSLAAGDRAIELNTTGTMATTVVAGSLAMHSLSTTPVGIYGFYPADGVVQMMHGTPAASFMPTNRSLGRLYMIGGGGPPVLPGTDFQGALDVVRVTDGIPPGQITALVSGAVGADGGPVGSRGASGASATGQTGFVEVLAGGTWSGNLDAWGADPFSPAPSPDSGCHFRQTGGCSGVGKRQPAGDQLCTATIPCDVGNCPSGYCECTDGQIKHRVNCHPGSHSAFTCSEFCTRDADSGTRNSTRLTSTPKNSNLNWSTSARFTPNNRNFPASGLPTTSANLPSDDLAGILTGIYGSAPGCLCTFPNSPSCPGLEGKHLKLGQIATTVARPDRGYAGTYNYFDPDNFFSMTALIYSGEPFLQEQARTVIERSGSFLCIGDMAKMHKCTYGQLPHHFEGDVPTFLALSGATQTGPNTFWVKSALQYARNSGNIGWLEGYMPTLRAAAAFCFDLIDDQNHLLLAPGSLMIDVFIRQNYTMDSNAMMVGFLGEFADAEDAIGNATGATALRQKASDMATAVNRYLWDGTDHYVTQVNPDDMDCAATKSCRDFVDYDSNLIAVAHRIPTPAQGKAVLHRIDTGIQKCTALQGGGPQWTSEIWYGKEDTTSGNIGDSSSGMGRIAWFDGKARKQVGDVTGFDTQIGRMQKDLLKYTWMHERYGCDGTMQLNRTAAYFEYPSTVAILLREIRYGIELAFDHVTVDPMPKTAFSYHIGNVNIDYKPNATSFLDVPSFGGQNREYRLSGMQTGRSYAIRAAADCAQAKGHAAMAAVDTVVATDLSGVLRFHAVAPCGVSVEIN